MKKLLIFFNGLSKKDYKQISSIQTDEAEILNLSDMIDDNYPFQLHFLNREKILSKHQDKVIEELTDFVGIMGENKIYKGKNVKQILSTKDGLSLWWFNLLQYKYYKEHTLCMHLAFLRVIEELLNSNRYDECIIFGGDTEYLGVIKEFLSSQKIHFALKPGHCRTNEHLIFIGGLFKTFVYSLFMILQIFKIKLFYKPRDRAIYMPDVSIFAIYPGSLIKIKDKIVERYYGGLPDKLKSIGLSINFVSILNLKNNLREIFNINCLRVVTSFGYNIVFLESFISIKDVISDYIEFLRIAFKVYFLPRKVKNDLFNINGKDYSLLFLKPFLCSMYDYHNFRALLLSGAAYKYAQQFKPKMLLSYCDVNHVGRAINHGLKKFDKRLPIVGLQHASYPRTKIETRYHRNEIDPEIGGKDHIKYVPFSDYELFQGKTTKDLFAAAGFPDHRSMLLGSPRFDSLYKYTLLSDKSGSDSNNRVPSIAQNIPKDKAILLVATGYFDYDIVQLLDILFKTVDEKFFIIFKPHPQKPLNNLLDRYKKTNPDVRYIISEDNVYELIRFADMLVTTHSTVAEEAIVLGKPSICVHAGIHLNVGALASLGLDVCASNPNELKEKIEQCLSIDKDSFEKMRGYVIKRCFGVLDGKATERIADFVAAKINRAAAGKTQ